MLQFIFFVYICNVIVHGTNKSTERNAPRVEVVTLNYILITINLCSFKPCNSWESGQGKNLEYGDTRLLGGEMLENEMEGMPTQRENYRVQW